MLRVLRFLISERIERIVGVIWYNHASDVTSFPRKGTSMTLTVEATYQNGVLKPLEPLPLQENECVRVTVHRRQSLAEQTAGMMGWKGDAETFERLLAENEEDV